MWEKALELLKSSPLCGFGITSHGYISIWNGYFSSHNTILEIMLQGGIVAIVFWIIFIKEAYKVYFNDKKISTLFIYFNMIILISLMMEADPHSIYMLMIISITYFYNKYCFNI